MKNIARPTLRKLSTVFRKEKPLSLGALWLLVRAARPPWALIALALGISVLDLIATLAFPIITRNLVDEIEHNEYAPFTRIFSDERLHGLILLLLAGAAAGAISGYVLSLAGLKITRRLTATLFEATMARPVHLFDRSESGQLVSRLTKDLSIVAELLTKSLSGLFTGVALLVGTVVILSLLDPALTTVVAGTVIGTFLLTAPILMRLAYTTKRANDASAILAGRITAVFSNIKLVKAFSAERGEAEGIEQSLNDVHRAGKRSAAIEAVLLPANSLAITFAMLTILIYGGARIQAGTLTIGTLTAFTLYIFNIVTPLIHFSAFFSALQAARGASGALISLLDGPRETILRPSSAPPGPTGMVRDLRFDKVRFGYSPGGGALVDLPNLIFPAGSTTVLTGPSGTGKTTIFGLIERFYVPSEGAIFYGLDDIANFNLDEWRRRIGYVPANAWLMRGTVADNVAYGASRPVDLLSVEAALTAARCMEFVSRLEHGIHAEIGEGGSLLSSGERQRLAIARALYRDPEILLFDEATANLDRNNERAILSILEQAMADRTVIIITHLPHLIAAADRVVELISGRVQKCPVPPNRSHSRPI